MTAGAGTQFVPGNERNNKDSFFFFNIFYFQIPKDVRCILSNHQEVLVLRLLKDIIFFNYEKLNIHQSKRNKNNY
jgi:hypothetical protein